jgi:TetR/AcrR family transcriptional repressor of nem operon
MARYASDHKQKTREAIVEAAARCIRAGGLDALGVASIMSEVGLTHGGFYAHFRSRDALLAAAVGHLFDTATSTLDRFEEKHGPRALERYVDFYLSPRHRDDASIGCPIPALAADMRNAAPVVRAAFDAGLEKLADRLGRLMPQGGRRAGLALLSEMSGVLSVSRTLADARASTELLSAKRKGLAV